MPTVLIVDDDPFIAKLFSEHLTGHGYEVLGAGNGEAGLDSVFQNEPDIILLDIMMPVMDGLTMLEELRKTSQVPVIIMSAFGSPENVEKARSLGIECFLTKPFDLEVLVEMLDVIFAF